MTINKSQGQSFDHVGIFLQEPVFEHGQLYVAFSRARSFAGIKVKIYSSTKQGIIGGCAFTPNIVYRQVVEVVNTPLN